MVLFRCGMFELLDENIMVFRTTHLIKISFPQIVSQNPYNFGLYRYIGLNRYIHDECIIVYII